MFRIFLGLIDESEDLQSALQWHGKLQEAGLMIRGNRLIYQEGVKRKRLPPRRLFAPSDSQQGELPEANCNEADPPDTHDCVADESIALDLEDRVLESDAKTAELPSRSRRFGVGKEIGYAVYVHRDYEERFGDVVEWAKRHLPENYEYTVVKLNQRNDSVSFIQCPGFDTEHEPAITGIVVVSADGQVQHRSLPADPYIYHHKWLFVADDYQGFDVAASKERSEKWMKLPDVDRSRIGRKSFWETQILPRLSDDRGSESALGAFATSGQSRQQAVVPPCRDECRISGSWIRSDAVRKSLRISTCELAHLRETGKIPAKKEGRAWLYWVESGSEVSDA